MTPSAGKPSPGFSRSRELASRRFNPSTVRARSCTTTKRRIFGLSRATQVRLPDGELTPPTLGALRARYGFTTVDENLPGDDIDGIHARSCRFPYLLFMLSVGDTSRRVPDSARVTRVDMDTHRVDYSIRQFCIAHQPPN